MIINPYPCTSLEAAALYIGAHPKVVGLTSPPSTCSTTSTRGSERCRRSDLLIVCGLDARSDGREEQTSTVPAADAADSNKNGPSSTSGRGQGLHPGLELLLSPRARSSGTRCSQPGQEVAVGNVRDRVESSSSRHRRLNSTLRLCNGRTGRRVLSRSGLERFQPGSYPG